jgi:diaminopimelate epimerase
MPDFVKSHGLGNDYLVMVGEHLPIELNEARIRLICHRNYGVGSDGILLLVPAENADFGLRIFNPDGSEAEKSGNGVRIFGKFLYDHHFTREDRLTVQTPGGLVHLSLDRVCDGRVSLLTANMGRATFDDIDRIMLEGEELRVTSVSVGNPHCVIVVPDVEAIDLETIGPKIETHPAFPNRTNVQFAQVLSRDRVKIVIWERGAGVTLASGSSSSAVAAATHRLGLTDSRVTVQSPGGELRIAIDDQGEIWLTGPVEEVCSGDLSPDLLARLRELDGPALRKRGRK